MRDVIVTGGLGFIGSHVTDAFLETGQTVTIIDSMQGAVVDGVRYDEHPACKVVRRSVQSYLRSGGSFNGADRVIHAAAHVGPAGILPFGGRLGHEIVESTAAVLDACAEARTPLCLFSSAEVYGRGGLLAEGDDIRVPATYNVRLEYAIAKTLTEAMASNRRRKGLRVIVVRPFNVAGPRQSRAGGFVMPTFVQQALASRPITVFGGGNQSRAFVDVRDITRFVTKHMDSALESSRLIFNLGNPANRTTIRALAERVKELLQSASPIVKVDARSIHGPDYEEAEAYHRVPVLEAATSVGWQPQAALDDLILMTAEHYRLLPDIRGSDAPL